MAKISVGMTVICTLSRFMLPSSSFAWPSISVTASTIVRPSEGSSSSITNSTLLRQPSLSSEENVSPPNMYTLPFISVMEPRSVPQTSKRERVLLGLFSPVIWLTQVVLLVTNDFASSPALLGSLAMPSSSAKAAEESSRSITVKIAISRFFILGLSPYLIPEISIPLIICFWKIRKTINGGIALSKEAAITTP